MKKLYLFSLCLFLTSLVMNVNAQITTSLPADTFNAGDTIHIPYTVSGSFKAGNVFTGQLSDASGSFASPVNIGNQASSHNSNTMFAIIPTTTNVGAGYRIRVVSSNPVVTGSDNGNNIVINNCCFSGKNVTTCDSYNWNGVTYTISGSYTYHTMNLGGADSAAVLNLTINAVPDIRYWQNLGAPGFSLGNVYSPSVALDGSGTPYAAYVDQDTGSSNGTVMKYNGIAWVTVGGAAFATGVSNTSIAIYRGGNPNVPYVAYLDGSQNDNVTVKKYNGSSWVTVGSAGFTGSLVGEYSPFIAIDPVGTPYVAYQTAGDSINVMKYNGSSWVRVGSPGSLTEFADWNWFSIAIDASGTPYVAYHYGNSATIIKYNGSSWVTVGGGFSGPAMANISMAIDGSGTPYVVYLGDDQNGNVGVMRYNGSAWVMVGAAFGGTQVKAISMAIDGSGTPYVAYEEGVNGYKSTVMKFTGNRWITMGNTEFSAGEADNINIAVSSSGAAYVVYSDATQNSKATVMNFGPPFFTGSTVVCANSHQTYSITPATGATLYTWTLPSGWSGTSTTNVINVTTGTAGGTISVTASDSCATAAAQTLNVTMNGNSASTSSQTITNCGSYTWNGNLYSTSGSYVYHTTNAVGCDSAATLNLTIDTPAAFTYWRNVGTAGFAGQAYNTSIAINHSGTPYVVYTDGANGNKATVMKYDGSNWVTVGNAGFSAGGVGPVSIALDSSGTPYVAYADGGNGYKTTVMKYNGSTWVTVGTAGFSPGQTGFVSLALDKSGTPYVAYGLPTPPTVVKYNGSNWVAVGSVFSQGFSSDNSIAIDGNGTPYVAFGGTTAVMKFNGSSWITVGNAGSSLGWTGAVSIRFDPGGIPYVSCTDGTNGDLNNRVTVIKYNGSSWVTVGSTRFSAGGAQLPSLAFDGSGTPYVAYTDLNIPVGFAGKATVMKYNGSNWVVVGSAGFSAGMAIHTSLAINASGTPYVAYADNSPGSINVMNFAPPVFTGNPVACANSAQTYSITPATGATYYTWTLLPGWSGSSTSNVINVVTGNTGGTISVTAGNNLCTSTPPPLSVTINSCTATLNLKMFIQGFYTGGGMMQQVLYNEGVDLNPNSTKVDTVTISLVNPSNGNVAAASKGVLQTNGSLSVTFPGATTGNYYYIYIQHRNSILTSSANPVLINSATNYDFSGNPSQAFGNHEIQVDAGIWAIYTGDINQDGYIDPFDFPEYDQDNSSQVTGVYVPTDFNGDGYVDPFDFPVYDGNNSLQIMVDVPW